jgi:hypothetical protein
MGTHFLGQKRLDKLSRKYNHIFDCAYEFEHKNGYQILLEIDYGKDDIFIREWV